MTDHLIGLAIAGLSFWVAPIKRGQRLSGGNQSSLFVGAKKAIGLMAVAMVAVGMFAVSQIKYPYESGPEVVRTQSMNGQSGKGDAANGSGALDDPTKFFDLVLPNAPTRNARVRIARDSSPVLGSPDAKFIFVCHVDYTCPHCRDLHAWFPKARRRWGDQIGIMIAPTPINARCNSVFRNTQARHREGCELALYVLTVWHVAPEKFEAFDTWLFHGNGARTAAQAHAKAVSLVGAEVFAKGLATGFAAKLIQRNVKLLEMATIPGHRSIPLVVCGDFLMRGRGTAEQLFKIVEESLDIKPVVE